MNKRSLIRNKAPSKFMTIVVAIILISTVLIGFAATRMRQQSTLSTGADEQIQADTLHRIPVPSISATQRPPLNNEDEQKGDIDRPPDNQSVNDQSTVNESPTSDETIKQGQTTNDADNQQVLGTRPTKVLLNLTTSVQETNYWCVPASMQMVLRYKGIDVSQADLAMQVNAKPATGTEYVDMQRVLNRYLFGSETVGLSDPGYHIQTLSRYDADPQIAADFSRRLLTDIATDDPLFAAVDVHTLYPTLPEANHMVVVIGYRLRDGSNDIDLVYFMDPSYLVQDATYGGLKTAPFDEFIAAIVNNDEPAYLY